MLEKEAYEAGDRAEFGKFDKGIDVMWSAWPEFFIPCASSQRVH